MFHGIIMPLLAGRSLEDPRVDLHDPEAWDEAFGIGSKTATGLKITPKSAMTYAAVWRAVNLISGDVAKLPCFVYARNGEGKSRATKHPAFPLLRHKANGDMTAFTVKQTLIQHALLRGNGYAYIVRDGGAAPLELLPLDPGATYPVRANGVLYYVTTAATEQRRIPATDMFHVKGLGFDGLVGYSVIEYASESLAMGLAAREYGARFYSNGAEAGVLLEHPGKISKDAAERLRDSWNKMHSGLENKHKTAVLEEGMTANKITLSARDSQLIESRQFEIREVANWFGVPPHKLGDTTRTAFASLEQENQSYLDEALDRWLVNFEEEARDKLLTEEEKRNDSHIVEFERKAMVRANLEARANYYRTAGGGRPWMTVNEIRGTENMNPDDDEDSNQLMVPLNIQSPISEPEQPSKPPPTSEPPQPQPPVEDEESASAKLDAAHRRLMLSALVGMVRRVGGQARHAAKKPPEFRAWLDQSLEADNGKTIAEAVGPVIDARIAAGQPCFAAGRLSQYLIAAAWQRLAAVPVVADYAEFTQSIDRVAAEMESALPESVVNVIFAKE